MNQKLLKAIIAKKEFFVSSGFFYKNIPDHIMCDFYCDKNRSGYTVLIYAIPLYMRTNILHLAYSKELTHPDQYIDGQFKNSDEFSEIFISRIEKYENQVDRLRFACNFMNFLNTFWDGDLQVTKAKILTLALLGKLTESQKEIDKLLNLNNLPPGFIDDVLTIQNDISLGQACVDDRLFLWEQEMKLKFKLK